MAKYKAFGATVEFNSVTYADATVVGEWGATRDVIDSTTHDSAGGYREAIGHLRDAKEVECVFNYDSVAHAGLLTAHQARTEATLNLTMSQGNILTMGGTQVVSIALGPFEVDGVRTLRVTFKSMTGALTIGP